MIQKKEENGEKYVTATTEAEFHEALNRGFAVEVTWELGERIGLMVEDVSGAIDWTAPRLLCIAGGFTRYDEHAVQQMNRNIELIRYRRFGANLLMLELVTAISAESGPSIARRDRLVSIQSKNDFGHIGGARQLASRSLPVAAHASHGVRRRRSGEDAEISTWPSSGCGTSPGSRCIRARQR